MAEQHTLTAYTDYKSPYAYLAKDLVYELQRDFPVRIDWLPYRLDIPSFLGSARLDDSGRIIEEQRNAACRQGDAVTLRMLTERHASLNHRFWGRSMN